MQRRISRSRSVAELGLALCDSDKSVRAGPDEAEVRCASDAIAAPDDVQSPRPGAAGLSLRHAEAGATRAVARALSVVVRGEHEISNDGGYRSATGSRRRPAFAIPQHLERAAYLELGRRAAVGVARRNGAKRVDVTFPEAKGSLAPLRVRVAVSDPIDVRVGSARRQVPVTRDAVAELIPPGGVDPTADPDRATIRARFAYRQGKPMRPDVAIAFDRLEKAATAAGHPPTGMAGTASAPRRLRSSG
jgi:hypothetical protein